MASNPTPVAPRRYLTRRRKHRVMHQQGELRAKLIDALPSDRDYAMTARQVAELTKVELNLARVRLLQLYRDGLIGRLEFRRAVRYYRFPTRLAEVAS